VRLFKSARWWRTAHRHSYDLRSPRAKIPAVHDQIPQFDSIAQPLAIRNNIRVTGVRTDSQFGGRARDPCRKPALKQKRRHECRRFIGYALGLYLPVFRKKWLLTTG
jgi:hypothetical protein